MHRRKLRSVCCSDRWRSHGGPRFDLRAAAAEPICKAARFTGLLGGGRAGRAVLDEHCAQIADG